MTAKRLVLVGATGMVGSYAGTAGRGGPIFENRDIRAMVASGATASGP